ncbi:hypothetical protein BJ912DRAFT_231123 [Pholiota molesta]|nr:hypothetical protein BJ912DRAFT_231123 [Pholiota molesta]
MNTSVSQILFPGDTILVYLQLAGVTCVVYDHLTTLDVEIEIIWEKPTKMANSSSIIHINRYLGLALQTYNASFFIKNLLGESAERYK